MAFKGFILENRDFFLLPSFIKYNFFLDKQIHSAKKKKGKDEFHINVFFMH